MLPKIVVSDTNIFIDLYSVGLLSHFFKLPFEIHTTDLVLSELKRPEQKKALDRFQKENLLRVISFDFEELKEICVLHETSQISMADSSLWFHARQIGASVLTGDGRLRRAAENDGIHVSGILFVFEKMLENKIIQESLAAQKLQCLMRINSRLPRGACERLLEQWNK